MSQEDLRFIRQEYQVYLLERVLIELEDAIDLEILSFKEFSKQKMK